MITIAAVGIAAILFAQSDSMARGGHGRGKSSGWGGWDGFRGHISGSPTRGLFGERHGERFKGREARHDFRFDHRDGFRLNERGRERHFARGNDGHWHRAHDIGGRHHAANRDGVWIRTPAFGEHTHQMSRADGQWHLEPEWR